jgi:haloacetate dehalogenase
MYLLAAPDAAFRNPFGEGSFGPEILEEYVSTYRDCFVASISDH